MPNKTIYVKDADETYRRALDAGATSMLDIVENYGDRFGVVRDAAGNTWCIAARCCDDDTARAILNDLLTSDSPYVSRNGPYFWAYLYPELARLGLHQLAISKCYSPFPIITLVRPAEIGSNN